MRLGSKTTDEFLGTLGQRSDKISQLFQAKMERLTKPIPIKVMLGDTTVTDQNTFDPDAVGKFYNTLLHQHKNWKADGITSTADEDLRRIFVKLECQVGNYILLWHLALQYHALLYYKPDIKVAQIQKELADIMDNTINKEKELAELTDTGFFAVDQARVMTQLMYSDWERDNGDAAYAAYKDVEREIPEMHANPGPGGLAPPGLEFSEFVARPEVLRHLRMSAACLDCVFRYGMSRDEYTRELHKWTEVQNVRTTIGNLENPEHFESGQDGESAARTYWVSIWALLFSMVGAVVHLFKMAFTLTEYVQRRAFQAVGAADSALARRVVDHSRRLIALGILALSLFIYFSDNRVTGNPEYARLHRAMWATQPVVGAIAAHWTINAQGLVYPFTLKIRPQALDFDHDPLAWMPSREPAAERMEKR